MIGHKINFNFLPPQGYGKATILLRMLKLPEAPVTMLVTTRCNINCDHCYAPKPRPPLELKTDLIKSAADELEGLEKLYFSGGEPSLHSRFMDLVHHNASRVKRLYIDTNGTFLSADLAGAVSQLNEFPKNTTLILSLDNNHALALARTGRSLEQIYRTLREACGQTGLGLEFNVRRPFSSALHEELQTVLPSEPCPSGAAIHINSILAQGSALSLPPSMTREVTLRDFIDHTTEIQSIGLFINPQGQIISGEHATFLENPPVFTVWGDLHQSTLSEILWQRLIEGVISNGADRISEEQALNEIADLSLPISWEVDQAQLQKLFSALPEEEKTKLLQPLVAAYGQSFLEEEWIIREYERFAIKEFPFSFEQGKLGIKGKLGITYYSRAGRFGAGTPLDSLKMALGITFRQAEETFGPESANKHFLGPLLSYLEENLSQAKNPLQVKFCVLEIRKKLGEKISAKEENAIVRLVDPKIIEETFQSLNQTSREEVLLPFVQDYAQKLLETDSPANHYKDFSMDEIEVRWSGNKLIIQSFRHGGWGCVNKLDGLRIVLDNAFKTIENRLGEKALAFFLQTLLSSLEEKLNVTKNPSQIKVCIKEIENELFIQNIPRSVKRGHPLRRALLAIRRFILDGPFSE